MKMECFVVGNCEPIRSTLHCICVVLGKGGRKCRHAKTIITTAITHLPLMVEK